MMMDMSLSKRLNEFLIYFVLIALLCLLFLSLLPGYGIEINNAHLLLICIIVGLLLFPYFRAIRIPGLLELTKEIKEVKEEQKELRSTVLLMQSISNAVNVNQVFYRDRIKEDAEVADRVLLKVKPKMNETELLEVEPEIKRSETFLRQGLFSASLANLRYSIENILKKVIEMKSGEKMDQASVQELAREAFDLKIINYDIFEAIRLIDSACDKLPHMSDEVAPKDAVMRLVEVGSAVLAGLYSIYEDADQTEQLRH